MVDKQQRGRVGMAAESSSPSVGGDSRIPLTGRTGAILMKSVSIFLASGRKISGGSRKHQSSSDSQEGRRRKKMPEDPAGKSAAYQARLIESLKKRTKFTKSELETLCKIYSKITSSPGTRVDPTVLTTGAPAPVQTVDGIDRTIFRELLHNTFDILTEDMLVERMFACWDKLSEGAIRLEPWITGLDTFLRGNLKEKMEFCFRVYDLNGDGFITKDEIFQLFKNCLMKQPGEEDPEEGVRDLSEMALKKLDVDHDGKISFMDYETSVRDEPLLLEAFGQILPTPDSAAAFLLTLKPT